jgi:hypothetical protein
MSFIVTLVAGAFLLAAWCDARLDQQRPATPARRIAHVAASCILLQVAGFGMKLFAPGDSAGAARQCVAVFVVLLPALVYAFVAGLWLLRTLAETALARR